MQSITHKIFITRFESMITTMSKRDNIDKLSYCSNCVPQLEVHDSCLIFPQNFYLKVHSLF